MLLLQMLAEQKIRAAQQRGELENLPGSGKPIQLDDDSAIPAEWRAGFRVLKNTGFLPPELEKLNEIRQVEGLIEQLEPGEERVRASRKLGFLKMQLSIRQPFLSPVFDEENYRQKLANKISGKVSGND